MPSPPSLANLSHSPTRRWIPVSGRPFRMEIRNGFFPLLRFVTVPSPIWPLLVFFIALKMDKLRSRYSTCRKQRPRRRRRQRRHWTVELLKRNVQLLNQSNATSVFIYLFIHFFCVGFLLPPTPRPTPSHPPPSLSTVGRCCFIKTKMELSSISSSPSGLRFHRFWPAVAAVSGRVCYYYYYYYCYYYF